MVAVVVSPLDGVPLPDGELALDPGASEVVKGRARVVPATLSQRPVDAYLVPGEDGRLAARLVTLGRGGLGGFAAGGLSDDGSVVVIRRRAARTLADLASGERLAEPLRVVREVAAALATAEGAALSPGPLRLADVALDADGHAFVLADVLIHALLGDVAAKTATTTGPSPRWTPPEQANGAPWDAAANRYVLGLIAYRLFTGEHPFAGAGMRHAIDAQARVVPPFADDVARGLRAGVQSLVLSMLDPDPRARPRSARAIVARLEELAGERSAPAPAPSAIQSEASREVAAAEAASPRARPSARQRPVRSVPRAVLLAVFGGVSFLSLIAWITAPGARPRDSVGAPVRVRERGPVTSSSAEACAPCHAKEVEEWKRSVMAFSSTSPLYRALESAVEEQVGRDDRCPGGAGVLRTRGAGACVDPATSLPITGSGGEHWCVHCHAPLDKLGSRVPAWIGVDAAGRRSRPTLTEALSPEAREGISCVACHASVGPVDAHASAARRGAGRYEGNPIWTSTRTGATFSMRPEDARGVLGISNSGYGFDPSSFFRDRVGSDRPFVHDAPSASTRDYLRSSEFCGACHDVRLFGTDVIGVRDRGEHFKRLRNAYSEWRSWADTETRAGRRAATCQECHMSTFPGVCEAGAPRGDLRSESCPPGTGFVARAPGRFGPKASHYFTGVEVPQSDAFDPRLADETGVDADGVPLGLRARRDLLLRSAFRLALGQGRTTGGTLEVPVVIENVGAGHRVPAGFSQEREFWVELRVRDARGAVVYEVGRVDQPDQDLPDKRFLRVRTDDSARDGRGRPLGVFGADVTDGPDVGRWSPDPARGGTEFRGLGLINFQNGFLRCVRCIGVIAGDGSCQPGPGQGATRADRFEDGDYDLDTGECRSNLSGGHELFETYFPIGALDADRGVVRAPDAIIDTRSAPPGVPIRYTYVVPGVGARPRPFHVEARLRFRAFPPFLLRAFAQYERDMERRGDRPSGPQLDARLPARLDIVDLARTELEVP